MIKKGYLKSTQQSKPTQPKTKKEKHLDELYKKKRGRIRENVEVVVSAVVIAIIIRIFLVEAYMIPSPSMYPNLIEGDHLLVNKFFYGVRIPVLNIKLPGFTQPNSSDIVVFQVPNYTSPGMWREFLNLVTFGIAGLDNTRENPKLLIKRAIGVPGDLLRMDENAELERGNKSNQWVLQPMLQELTMKSHSYKSWMVDWYVENNLDSEYVIQRFRGGSNLTWHGTIYLARVGDQLTITRYRNAFNESYSNDTFEIQFKTKEGREVEGVDMESFKRFYLPPPVKLYRSDEVARGTVLPYEHDQEIRRFLETHSKDDPEVENELTLTFEENYYVLLGDNRDDSTDSRVWGALPEKNIFGNALLIYYPFDRMGSVQEDVNTVRNYLE
jgi:signal peptidase I